MVRGPNARQSTTAARKAYRLAALSHRTWPLYWDQGGWILTSLDFGPFFSLVISMFCSRIGGRESRRRSTDVGVGFLTLHRYLHHNYRVCASHIFEHFERLRAFAHTQEAVPPYAGPDECYCPPLNLLAFGRISGSSARPRWPSRKIEGKATCIKNNSMSSFENGGRANFGQSSWTAAYSPITELVRILMALLLC
jgi:hypothetical protein